ncbi:MAG: ABC transporter substrate-binding protein [Candidatus Nomurabacteria bacterium]|nr:ABC transporter substrate-binding protein [Candidatus Nomurabacteria bacterium]
MKGNFQIIILVIFIAAAVLGVFVFSGAIPIGNNGNSNGAQGTVVLWGTVKTQDISSLIEDFNRANPTFVLKYEEKSPDTFDNDLLEALAAGVGPDMFFISDDLAFKYSNKIYTITYQSFPLNTFKNSFVGAGEVFLTSKGILALPITVNPMIMYYNRSILDANGVTYPPAYWDEFSNLVSLLTKKDDKGAIVKSTIAMGQFSNVLYAKDILATLFMQAGNPIIAEKNGSFMSTLNQNSGQYDLGTILKFYTDFADPLKDVYSWNKSFSNSRDAFSAENLAFYFGYASELQSLVDKNPNQNFLMAPMPQIRNNTFKLTSAHVTGIAISSFSKNLSTAFIATGLLANGDFASKMATSLGLAPARRNLLKTIPADAYSPTFYSSALFARSWLDPSPKDTNIIFQGMVEKVLSNSMSVTQAISDAGTKLGLLLIK